MKSAKSYTPRFRVSATMAELCLDFMAEMDPSELAASLKVLDAVEAYMGSERSNNAAERDDAIECARQAIESWMAIDRAACVGLLGPGLGVGQ